MTCLLLRFAVGQQISPHVLRQPIGAKALGTRSFTSAFSRPYRAPILRLGVREWHWLRKFFYFFVLRFYCSKGKPISLFETRVFRLAKI